MIIFNSMEYKIKSYPYNAEPEKQTILTELCSHPFDPSLMG